MANKASTARENAMSVAVGTAHPWAMAEYEYTSPDAMVSRPGPGGAKRANRAVTARNSTGGTIMPPTAHSIGTAAALGLAREPVVSSCFKSSPTIRKNTVSKPS